MKLEVKVVILTLVLAVFAFLANPNGPLGGFWAPSHDFPSPSSSQLPFFILLNMFEAITFGLGISFLIFGYPLVRAVGTASPLLTRGAHLSIAWLLINWFPHDSMHVHNGMDLGGLLVLEYAFHVTLMLAGVILAYFFVTVLRERAVLAH